MTYIHIEGSNLGPEGLVCQWGHGADLQHYNAAGSADDRLHRPRYLKLWGATLTSGQATMYYEYDDAGRVTNTVRNYGSTPSEVVQTTYTPDGQVATLTALNGDTGNQVTSYTYGVDLTNSAIASKDLLRQVTYPDNGEVLYGEEKGSERNGINILINLCPISIKHCCACDACNST